MKKTISLLAGFLMVSAMLPFAALAQDGIGDTLSTAAGDNVPQAISAVLLLAGAAGILAVLWGVYTVFFAKRSNPQAPVGWGLVALIGGPVLMSIPVFTGVLGATFLGADAAGDAADELDLDLGSAHYELRVASLPVAIEVMDEIA